MEPTQTQKIGRELSYEEEYLLQKSCKKVRANDSVEEPINNHMDGKFCQGGEMSPCNTSYSGEKGGKQGKS